MKLKPLDFICTVVLMTIILFFLNAFYSHLELRLLRLETMFKYSFYISVAENILQALICTIILYTYKK